MGLGNWLKHPVLGTNSNCGVITKNGSFGELGHQGFIAFLVIDWVYYRFVTVRWRL